MAGTRKPFSTHDEFMTFFYDCRFIVLLHAALLAVTFAFGGANQADVRVQLSVLLFLLPGWWIAPRWMGEHTSPLRRYAGAMTTSVAMHALVAFFWTLPFIATVTGGAISQLIWGWLAIVVICGLLRSRTILLHSPPDQGRRLAPRITRCDRRIDAVFGVRLSIATQQ